MSDVLLNEVQSGVGWANLTEQAQVNRLLNHLLSANSSLKVFRRGTDIVFQNTAMPRVAFDSKVDPDNRSQIIVGSQRAVAGYQFDDHVRVDARTYAVTVAETVAVSETSFIYYEIPDNGTPIPVLKASATYPAPAAAKLNVVLGKAIWDAALGASGEVSAYYVYHHGQIEISSGPTPTTDAAYLVKVTSHDTGKTYFCDVYGNGSGSAATATGQPLIVPQIVTGDALPANTWVNAILIGTNYEAQVPVWQDIGGAGVPLSSAPSAIIQTTDATTTTATTYTMTDGTTVSFTATIAANGTNRGAWSIVGTFYRDTTVNQQGPTTVIHAQTGGAYTVAFDISGNDVRVRVTGAAADTVDWRATGEVVVTEAP